MTITAAGRPDGYDDKVVAHRKLIMKIVHRYNVRSEEDMVQEISAELFARWKDWDSERYRFATWVWTVAGNVITAEMRRNRAKKRSARTVSYDDGMEQTAQPSQLEYAALSQALRRLSGTRDSEALMRIAMGDELQDVAVDMGISRERVRQLAVRERGRLGRAA